MVKIKDLGKKTNSALGIFTVACGFVMMWASSLGGSTTRSSLMDALQGAVEVDASRPNAGNNGKVVVASGALRGDVPLEDEFLHPLPAIRLVRHVEMFQWVENVELEDKPSDPAAYSLEWVPREVDFFRFRAPEGHENPVMKVQPFDKRAPTMFFGEFDGARIVDVIEALSPVRIAPEMLKDSSHQIKDNKLLIKREPGMEGVSLGDMRVWYESLPAGDYTVIARQVDEMSLVGSRPAGEVFIQRGRHTANELLDAMSQGAKQAYTGMLFLGAVLMTIGFVSVMKPHAHRFDLNPKIDIKGMPAVVLVSAGISCALMGIFMVLSLVG